MNMPINPRGKQDKLIDWARISECKTTLLMITYQLIADNMYTKEHAVKDLGKEIERLQVIEDVHLELESHIELLETLFEELKPVYGNTALKEVATTVASNDGA